LQKFLKSYKIRDIFYLLIPQRVIPANRSRQEEQNPTPQLERASRMSKTANLRLVAKCCKMKKI
jgi:hypothetical protein